MYMYYNSLYACLWPHKTVCHARHKAATQFMLIPYDVDQNHSRTHTNVRLVWVFCQFRSHKLANIRHQRPIEMFSSNQPLYTAGIIALGE